MPCTRGGRAESKTRTYAQHSTQIENPSRRYLTGVLCAPLPLLADRRASKNKWGSIQIYTLRGVDCILAVIGTGGPVKRSNITQ
eukprot:8469601-Pyramimonas_sp.AAC.1